MKKLRVTYSYDDVTLVPAYSEIKSRSMTNPSMNGYNLPVIMSPMDTVTTPEMIRLFVENNLVATVHRMFKSPQEQFAWVLAEDKYTDTDEMKELISKVYFSVGSVWKYKEWIDSLYAWGVKNFLVDMAHGDSLACVETIKYIKSLDKSLSIIAGNVASLDGFKRLQKAGADGVRVGIASGSICFTPTTKVAFVSASGKVFSKEIKFIEVGDKVLTASGHTRKVINKFINDYYSDANADFSKIVTFALDCSVSSFIAQNSPLAPPPMTAIFFILFSFVTHFDIFYHIL